MKPLVKGIDECRQCAGLFRLGRDVEAALNMVDLFDETQRQIAQAPQDVQQAWALMLRQMLACQERQDWLGLADFIEYELIELLENMPA
jgi:hypothetical protein